MHVIATAGHVDGALTFDDLLAGDPLAPTDLAEDALAALMFTSGTAGASIAAMLSHGNIGYDVTWMAGAAIGLLIAPGYNGFPPSFSHAG